MVASVTHVSNKTLADVIKPFQKQDVGQDSSFSALLNLEQTNNLTPIKTSGPIDPSLSLSIQDIANTQKIQATPEVGLHPQETQKQENIIWQIG